MASTMAFLTCKGLTSGVTSASSLLLRAAASAQHGGTVLGHRGLSLSAVATNKEVFKRDKPHVNIGENEKGFLLVSIPREIHG